MASNAFLAPVLYRCYYCQFESTENSFKYFDNKKADQPRHQCLNCHKLFTLGSHGRAQGKTYAKKRNEDPEELKSLSRQCRHCGVADNASFKYYNNNNRLQPRFKCRSCGKQFQMRLMGIGKEMRLVHTSCNQRHATSGGKSPEREFEAFTNASDFGVQESSQPSSDDGPFMLMPLDPGMMLLPENYEEDEQFASFLEAGLMAEEEPPNTDPISSNANVDNGLLPEFNTEEAQPPALLEFESLTNENEQQAPNADPIIRTLNEDDGLSPRFTAVENAEFLAFLEAGFLTNGSEAPDVDNVPNVEYVDYVDYGPKHVDEFLPWSGNESDLIETSVMADESNAAEMVSENTADMDSNCISNPEVVSGTQLVETHAPTELDSWNNDTIEDSSSVNYQEAAIDWCKFLNLPADSMDSMDLEMTPWS